MEVKYCTSIKNAKVDRLAHYNETPPKSNPGAHVVGIMSAGGGGLKYS